ncbi:MAG: ATP synthase F1 subunit gamma [Eubacteriales bacterium]|nr:ATP synthase F1 subunit gamma [Eubacteriales bacterium]
MPSMKEIKRRRDSIESTGQITKAMKLVATVKLQKTREKAESNQAFFETLYTTMADILKKSSNIQHKYIRSPLKNENSKKALVVISANRGLAGGYNANISRLILSDERFNKDNSIIYAIGRKAKESLQRKGFIIEKDYSDLLEDYDYSDVIDITKGLLKDYESGNINEIYLVYTYFKNTVFHVPRILKLMPFDLSDDISKDEIQKKGFTIKKSQFSDDEKLIMNFEPNEEDLITLLVPKYLSSLLNGALLAAEASENGSRMNAMDSATQNAQDLIQHLSIQYNRARQGAITQELTEIVAGANAING